MATTIKFSKMHGAGNDYIYVNTLLYNIPDPSKASIVWSAPHTGIGSDGLVLIGEAKLPEADFSMRIFNADGSEAMMCGNASRCIGKYLFEKGMTKKTEIRLLTLSGIKVLKLTLDKDNRKVDSVTVDMLEPILANKAQMASEDGTMTDGLVDVIDKEFRGTFVSMGNPHFVIFVDDIETIDIARYGKALEHDSLFPQRCNIEFAQVMSNGKIRTRVWERGSGITMACGTGSCATVMAAISIGLCSYNKDIAVELDGGTLIINISEDNTVTMTGPAEISYEGEVNV